MHSSMHGAQRPAPGEELEVSQCVQVSLFVEVIHCTLLHFQYTGFYFCQLPETDSFIVKID